MTLCIQRNRVSRVGLTCSRSVTLRRNFDELVAALVQPEFSVARPRPNNLTFVRKIDEIILNRAGRRTKRGLARTHDVNSFHQTHALIHRRDKNRPPWFSSMALNISTRLSSNIGRQLPLHLCLPVRRQRASNKAASRVFGFCFRIRN